MDNGPKVYALDRFVQSAAASGMRINRREVVRLITGSAVSLLSSCVAAPGAAPTTAPPGGAPGTAPTSAEQPPAGTTPLTTAPTQARTTAPAPAQTIPPTPVPPTQVPPTAAPTSVPPTQAPTPVPPMPAPTRVPTAVPTVETPPALAAAVDGAMQHAMQSKVTPGGVALVQHKGAQILLKAYGLSRKYDSLTQLSPDPIEATTDTLYDLASLSKLFTTTCVMRLVEQGRLTLDDPVAQWMADFAAGGKGKVTLRQLLTHTSGLPDYLQLWKLEPTPAARIQRVLATPLINSPGTVFLYSDLGLIATGHLVELITGASLDAVVRDMVTAPLQLTDTMYRPPDDLKPRIAPTEDEETVGRGMVWGEVHDENSWSLGGVAGHAGIFSTAENMGRLAQLYLNDGTLDGTRLLREDSVAEMTRNQIPGIGWRGIGWELNADYYMGHLASPQTYGHTGFTGTSLVVDPRRELIVVLLMNRVHPTRNGPSENPTRQAVADAALAAADAA